MAPTPRVQVKMNSNLTTQDEKLSLSYEQNNYTVVHVTSRTDSFTDINLEAEQDIGAEGHVEYLQYDTIALNVFVARRSSQLKIDFASNYFNDVNFKTSYKIAQRLMPENSP